MFLALGLAFIWPFYPMAYECSYFHVESCQFWPKVIMSRRLTTILTEAVVQPGWGQRLGINWLVLCKRCLLHQKLKPIFFTIPRKVSASFSNNKIGGCYWRPKTASKAKGQKVRPFLMKRTQDNAINMPSTIKYFSIEYYDVFGPRTGLYLAFWPFCRMA